MKCISGEQRHLYMFSFTCSSKSRAGDDADLASRPLKVSAPLRRSQTLGPEVTLAPPPRYHLTHPLALHSLSLIIPPVQLGGQSFLYLDHPCTMARSYLPAPFIFA